MRKVLLLVLLAKSCFLFALEWTPTEYGFPAYIGSTDSLKSSKQVYSYFDKEIDKILSILEEEDKKEDSAILKNSEITKYRTWFITHTVIGMIGNFGSDLYNKSRVLYYFPINIDYAVDTRGNPVDNYKVGKHANHTIWAYVLCERSPGSGEITSRTSKFVMAWIND